MVRAARGSTAPWLSGSCPRASSGQPNASILFRQPDRPSTTIERASVQTGGCVEVGVYGYGGSGTAHLRREPGGGGDQPGRGEVAGSNGQGDTRHLGDRAGELRKVCPVRAWFGACGSVHLGHGFGLLRGCSGA